MKDPNLKGKRYVALTRCSTKGQADTSIDDQVRLIDRFGIDNEMIRVDDVRLEGVSGSVAKNLDIAVAALIKRKGERNDFDVVVVQDATRFSRAGAGHAAKLRYELQEAGIEVINALGHVPKSEFSEVKDAMDSVVARQQAKGISAGVARGSQSALEQGRKAHCSKTPYGLNKLYLSANGKPAHVIQNLCNGTQQRLHPSTGEVLDTYGRNEETGLPRHYRKQKDEQVRLIPGSPDQIETVQFIYRKYFVDRMGYWSIASELNGRRVPSSTGRDWTLSAIKGIIDNPVYTGLGISNRQSSALYYCRAKEMPKEAIAKRKTESGRPAESIRPVEDWEFIQYPDLAELLPADVRARALAHHAAIIADSSPGRDRSPKDKHVNSAFLLKGLLKTTEGHPMTGRRKGKLNGTRYYAVGRAYSAPRDGDYLRTLVRADPVEAVAIEMLKELLLSLPSLRDDLVRETKAALKRRAGAPADRAGLEVEILRLDARIRLAINMFDGADESVVRAAISELKLQRREATAKLASMERPIKISDSDIETMVDAMIAVYLESAEALRDLPSAHLRELLEAFVESMTVDLKTMRFDFVLRLPPWGHSVASKVGISMGPDFASVYKGVAEAHRLAFVRREFGLGPPKKAA